MAIQNKQWEFDALKNGIQKVKDELPKVLANQAQNYFTSSFTKQGWNGEKWKEVQRRTPGTKAYKYPKTKDLGRRTRYILIGKGSTKLRRAVNNSIRVASWPQVLLIVDLPYAQAHNEGLGRMPKRQYMGQTDELGEMQKKKIREFVTNVLGMFLGEADISNSK